MQIQVEKTQCPKCFATLRCRIDAKRVKCPKCQFSFQAFPDTAEDEEALECDSPPIIQVNATAIAPHNAGPSPLEKINWGLAGKISGAILAGILLLSLGLAMVSYAGNDNAEKSLLQIPGLTIVIFLFSVVSVASFIGTTALYLTPIYVAYTRKHPNFIPIAIITATAGWTVIGWAGCLAWAFTDTRKS
jgi:hypothetical protein